MSLTRPPPGAGALLGRTFGISMWPALRPGDLLFGHRLEPDERPALGSILVAQGPHGPFAHRLIRITGTDGSQRFILAGDVSGPDFPIPREAIESVASALYRSGSGFRDIPQQPPQGPLSRRMLHRALLLLLTLANRGSRSENLIELALDDPAVQRALQK